MSESSVVAKDPAKPQDPDGIDPAARSPRQRYERTLSRLPSGLAGGALELSWFLAGVAFGAAVAHVFHWSTPSTAVAALAVGALSWWGRGLSTFLLATTVTFAGLAAGYRITMMAFPHQTWSLRWLGPVSVVLVVFCVLLARRLGVSDWQNSRAAAAVVDLAAGGSSLVLAALLVHRLAGTIPAAVLLRSEDNDSWLATMSSLHGAHGVTAVTTTVVPTYGSVAIVFFSFVRSATGGLVPGSLLAPQDASGLLSAHMLLAVLCPVVGGLLARRTLRYGRPILSLAAWFLLSVLLASFSLTLSWFGFLTADLAILLFVTAAYLVTVPRIDLGKLRSVVVWLAAALLIYAAGCSWLPLVPLAGLGLVGWYATIALRPLLRRQWSQLWLLGLLAAPTLLLGLALYRQYRNVLDVVGGGDALLNAPGGAPTADQEFMAAAVLAVLAGWLINRRSASVDRAATRTFAIPVAWIVTYLVVITLDDAWKTSLPAHYGSLKLLYVVLGISAVLGVADLLSSPAIGTGSLDAVAAVLIGVLFLGTVGVNAPVYGATEAHWPVPIPSVPAWTATVNRLVAGNSRVLCLAATATRDFSDTNYDAYHCSRYASSLQGREDATSLAWRYAQVGLQSPVAAAQMLHSAKDLPWTILVIGNTDGLHTPTAWYAGLVSQPGLTFVHVKT